MNKVSIAIFASGAGSNAVNLINHFANHPKIEVRTVFCNKADALVIKKAQDLGVEACCFSNQHFENAAFLTEELTKRNVIWIILAGFLRKIPEQLVASFPNRIINIHPSLLPKYGGKGMYGMHVHKAVIAANEQKSGITIHLIDEEFDKGRIIEQFETTIEPTDTAEDLAKKIHILEQEYFPVVVENTILN